MGRVPAGGSRLTPRAFTYHHGVAPLLWVFVGLAVIELLVVHLLVSLWNPTLGLILSALTIGGVGWLIHAIIGMARRPVLIADDHVLLRVGTLKQIAVPLDRIAGLQRAWPSGAIKQPGIASFALIAHPNVLIEIAPPLTGRRGPIRGVAHRIDDPDGFAAALQAAMEKWKR